MNIFAIQTLHFSFVIYHLSFFIAQRR